MTQPPPPRPLDGVRVVEMGQLMAGPFAGTLLAYYGAEVIKVEPPGTGDAIRGWRHVEDGTSLWWRSLGRNKKCVTLDLRQEKGRALARRLVARADVLIENFRPGTLEAWGLDPQSLQAENPRLVLARVSGYGQTGPNAGKPGFASVCEAFGGLRYVTGHPGEPPVRANLSLGDSLAGLHAAFGVLLALRARDQTPFAQGQTIDLGIFEAVYNLMEAVVPEYDRAGVVREPAGTTITGVVPTNLYRTADGQRIVLGANGDSMWKRLMHAAGRPEMAEDPRLATNAGRVAHQQEVEDALAAWIGGLPAAEALARLEAARVPAGPIYSAADMLADPHYQARGLFEEVEVGGRPLKLPALVPKLTATPGRTDWPGPALGEHNQEVLGGLLGVSEEEMVELGRVGVI
jgi:crotonobetainyl-CoA:carnitine CoA-transferase CaiB-like acyl-CoA transferase